MNTAPRGHSTKHRPLRLPRGADLEELLARAAQAVPPRLVLRETEPVQRLVDTLMGRGLTISAACRWLVDNEVLPSRQAKALAQRLYRRARYVARAKQEGGAG